MSETEVYYAIRHVATKEFMPQLIRAGYSHWNPGNGQSSDVAFGGTKLRKLTGTPRLFPSRKKAIFAIAQWNANPNSRMYRSFDGEGSEDNSIDIKDDGRRKEDLEIIEVEIIEVKR